MASSDDAKGNAVEEIDDSSVWINACSFKYEVYSDL